MHISDCLSRCIAQDNPRQPPVFTDTLSAGVFEVNVTAESDVQKIRSETAKDPAITELI